MARLWIIGALLLGGVLVGKACNESEKCVHRNLCEVESSRFIYRDACYSPNVCCVKRKSNTDNPESEVNQCGLSNSNGLDTNMQSYIGQAKMGQFPWTIAVFSNDQYIGGGTLIAPGVVLTTAHLLKWRFVDDIVVRAGDWDLSNVRERFPHEERGVRKIVRHAGFVYFTGANNLALLFLYTPFQIQEHIRPICLPQEIKSFEGKRCKVAGWGRSSYFEMRNTNIQKIVELPMVNSSTCQRQLRRTAMGPTFTLHPSLICAGGELNKDACVGDGGSALFCPLEEDPDRYEQVGIVNWGMECGREGVPATYTNVAMFKDWIDQQLKENTVFGFRTLTN